MYHEEREKCNQLNDARLLMVRPASKCENVYLKASEIEYYSCFMDEEIATRRR